VTTIQKHKRKGPLEHQQNGKGISTSTAIAVVVQMDVDWVTEFTTELLGLFLGQGTACDDLILLAWKSSIH
jgi:hypothetical protein